MHLSDASTVLTITIDSGASESAISELRAPQYPTSPSIGSREGLCYTAANGATTRKRGEAQVRFRTADGHRRILKMHVTDVQAPLISVSRLFTHHEERGQTTPFHRDDNNYRAEVETGSPSL